VLERSGEVPTLCQPIAIERLLRSVDLLFD
jgi:hypothetical protein